MCDSSGHLPEWLANPGKWAYNNVIKPAAKQIKTTLLDTVEAVKNCGYSLYYNATRFHFEDRIVANGQHATYDAVKENSEWRLLPREESLYHIDDKGKDELKYIHPDGREAVFNGDTLEPMTDPRYMATYNYVALYELPNTNASVRDYIKYGLSYVGHFAIDVVPYWLTLNSNTREQFEGKVIAIFG